MLSSHLYLGEGTTGPPVWLTGQMTHSTSSCLCQQAIDTPAPSYLTARHRPNAHIRNSQGREVTEPQDLSLASFELFTSTSGKWDAAFSSRPSK